MDDKPKVTKQGGDLVRRWVNAKAEVERISMQLVKAQCVEKEMNEQLGKWLAPSDIRVGERIGVWLEDKIVYVTKNGSGQLSVQMRPIGQPDEGGA